MLKTIGALAAGLCLMASTAYADLGETIGFQGRLLTAGGSAVPDGDYGLTISFYKNKLDDKAVYVDTKAAVKVTGGLFSVQIGAPVPLNSAVFKSGEAAWVGLSVGSENELPRVALQHVPYAIRAQTALDLQCSGCLTAAHLGADVLKPFAKSADLSAVATSGSYKDLKNTPTGADFALSDQKCAAGEVVTGIDAAGKAVCGPGASPKDFAVSNQACASGAIVTGVDAVGKLTCATPTVYGGKDFAVANQACGVGSVVTGIDGAGKVTCVTPKAYSGSDFAVAAQACGVGTVVTGIDGAGKVTCVAPKAYSGSDFAVAAQACGSGELVTGIDASGKVTCAADVVYTGKDFALAGKACGAGSLMSGINADGTPACAATVVYKNGTGLTLASATFALDTAYTDGQYVNENQASSVSGAMIKDGEVKTAELADGAVTAAKLGELCKDGETLQFSGGKWACAASNMLGSVGVNLVVNPSLADYDGNGVPDGATVESTAGNQKFAKLAIADVNAALGTNLAHEAVNTAGIDLRSTGDGTSESMVMGAKVQPAYEPNAWITCSVYVRRPDATGTNAKVKLDCFGASTTLVIPNSDQTWKRVSVSTQLTASSKVAATMRVYGSGQATGGDSSFLRYALPKVEYGRIATDWNAGSGGLPTGMIAFFAGPCPSGWTEYTALRGRVAMGLNAGGSIAATVGTALADKALRQITDVPAHTHTIDPPNTTSTGVGDHLHSIDPPNTTSTSAGAHAHTIDPPNTTTTGVGDHSHPIFTLQDDWNVSGGTGPSWGRDNGPNQAYHATAGAGAHSHDLNIGAFASTTDGAHTHAVDIGAFNSAAAGAHSHDVDVGAFPSASTGSAAVDVSMPYIQLTACRAN